MVQNYFALVALLPPVLFITTSLITLFRNGSKIRAVKRMSIVSSVISIATSAVCGFFVMNNGLLESGLIGFKGVGLSIRLDAVSVLMLSMIALLGFIIVRFSINYLDGDKRQDIFIARLAVTLASIHLFVIAGNLGLLYLAWVSTSMALHRLLLFYSERPGAIVASKKKFLLARLGDCCLLIALALLYKTFGSGSLEVIFNEIKNSTRSGVSLPMLEVAALFVVFAALLKSAQFPTHGWLIEIMETPTPVSALLHAGLINAGPFLIIRMAYMMEQTTVAPLVLMAIGGFTAVFASAVYLTQTSVKTALSYSSVAHMGFSLMLGGLGVYPAAMLHLVAHSFYKAHAFLSSGSVIDVVRASKISSPTRQGKPWRIAFGIVVALALYLVSAILWKIDFERELPIVAVGAIIVMGLSMLFTSAIDSKESSTVLIQTSLLALVVTAAFFALESGMHKMLTSQLPEMSNPGLTKIMLTSILLIAFGTVVFLQILSPLRAKTRFYQTIAIHLRNGLYVNAFFDRMIGALQILPPRTLPVSSKLERYPEVPLSEMKAEEQPV